MSKKKHDKRTLYKLRTLAGVLTDDQLAAMLGIKLAKFNKLRRKSAEYQHAIDIGRANTVKRIAGVVVQKALNGNLTAAMFYLRTKGGWSENAEEVSEDTTLQFVIRTTASNRT